MTARKMVNKGFTLVEILIVVVILGILAAIVIPQFTSASEAANLSSATTQLQSIRSQLELYQLQHNGNYPPSTSSDAFWEQLTSETDDLGTVVTDGSGFGPYLPKRVQNPLNNNSSDIVTVADTATTFAASGSNTAGFAYQASTGEIRAFVSEARFDKLGLDEADGDFLEYGAAAPAGN